MSDSETMTSTLSLLKEMKDQMVALAEKVEEFQHNQTLTNRGLKCEEFKTIPWALEIQRIWQSPSMGQAVLDYVGQHRAQLKRGMSVLACQIVIASNAQN